MYRRIVCCLTGAALFYLRHRDRLLLLPVCLGIPIILPLDYATRAIRRRARELYSTAENASPREST